MREAAHLLDGAMHQLNELAEQLRKSDPTLTKEQAFAKVYSDRKNRELRAQEYQERMEKVTARAS